MDNVNSNENVNENEFQNVENIDTTSALQEFIEALLTDEQLKEKFIESPDSVIDGYGLNESQRLLLKSLDKEDIMKLTPENVEEFFSADSAVYTPEIDEDMLNSNEQKDDDVL